MISPDAEAMVDAQRVVDTKSHRRRRPSSARIGGEHPLVQAFPSVTNGASNVMPSPVPNPSGEIEKLWTRTWTWLPPGA